MKNQNGFATVFSLFMSLLLLSFCFTFVLVASVLSVKHKAKHAAEEAALITASTLDCNRAIEQANSNSAELITCKLNSDFVYIETFTKFNSIQIKVFSNLGIDDYGVKGSAKAK